MSSFDELDVVRLRDRPGAKWQLYGPEVLPSWVADMDVEPAPPVRAALQSYLDRGDLGYAAVRAPQALAPVAAARMKDRFGWEVDPDEVVVMTDVVQGIEAVLHLWAEPASGVAIQTPIYPPFLRAIDVGRYRLVDNPLVRTESSWELDVAGLRRAIVTEGCRVLLLCNPHNPTGRAFRADELEQLAAVAEDHDLLVISDEIWADVVHAPNVHLPFAALGPEVQARTVTLTSATKAFGMPAVKCAVAHLGHAGLRERFAALPSHLFGSVSQFGVLATLAAWEEGDEWLAELVDHLGRQRRLLVELMAERLPDVPWVVPEATYLAWLDFRGAGLPCEPCELFLSEAKVALGKGPDFGVHGEGFTRLNFATTSAVLSEIVDRMAAALAAATGGVERLTRP